MISGRKNNKQMKNKILFFIALVITCIVIITGCKKDATLPDVITSSVSSVTDTSVICGGNVTSDGGAAVTEKGVLWSLEEFLYFGWSSQTSDGMGEGPFTSSIDYLTPATEYFIQAYAINSVGIAYGEKISFTTLP
jgi:hypothetical protein